MRVSIPGLSFLATTIPLKFDTDGLVTDFGPGFKKVDGLDDILVLTKTHIELFGLHSLSDIVLSDALEVPDILKIPEVYDGSQNVSGKSILALMVNGWGDMILIQPALQAFYRKVCREGPSPRITVGCNWIKNFPYPDVPYVQEVRPNILTLRELSEYDFLINFIPVNYWKSGTKSMTDSFLEIMRVKRSEMAGPPFLKPKAERVQKIDPVLKRLRRETGKKLICVNWKSRFQHKNASPLLFLEIIERLESDYQAVLFKDEFSSRLMQKEINTFSMPIINLSFLIDDYHDTIAALSMVDAFISVDTGIVHAAGALGIPGIALFGPFPPETHIAGYRSVTGIRAHYDGRTCSGPCLETHRGCAEMDFSPTAISPCFEAVRADSIVEAFTRIIETSKLSEDGAHMSLCQIQVQ